MERKIGETFEFEGKTLQVKAVNDDGCEDCIFNVKCTRGIKSVTGLCGSIYRDDKKDVIFVEVKDEQQQEQAEQPQTEQQPQKLNLCEILKDCPMYEPFWSPMLGDVKFHHIDHEAKRILITLKTGTQWNINPDATITFANVTSPEIMFYPSREQRDWTKVKYENKKEKFDPKTLKPFDKVLARINDRRWYADFISIAAGDNVSTICTMSGMGFHKIIPYNDDTKHLVGTTDEAPEYYRYWED